MKQTVTESMFIDAFRQISPENFTISGLRAMFEYFDNLEEETGEEIELDVIAICVDFAQYTEEEIRQEYSHIDGIEDAENLEEIAEILNDYAQVIPVEANKYDSTPESLIISSF